MDKLCHKAGIIQRYISSPLLIDGYKFDLRVYVVVLSFDPLKVYINEEGLARLATKQYSISPETLHEKTMHLTNYSVNRHSPAFVKNLDEIDFKKPKTGIAQKSRARPSKLSFKELREYFRLQNLDFEKLFDNIKDIIIKTLIAAAPQVKVAMTEAVDGQSTHRSNCCFEIYGFDILVDRDMQPWLLEVNIRPSLSSGSPLDARIKTKLVADTLTLVGIQPPLAQIHRSVSGSLPSAEELKQRARQVAACNATEAISLFDELAWELVLDSCDEDLRRGGLERIFPTAQSEKYMEYFPEDSYMNTVLWKWYQANGVDLLRTGACHPPWPHWQPRQECFPRMRSKKRL